MTRRVQRFLIGSGSIFLFVSLIRFYLLTVVYPTDRYFALHFMVTLLSLVIAGAVLKVGFEGNRITRRSALSLIRSGSILLMIWGYRLCLILRAVRSPFDLKPHFYLAVFYVISGTFVMFVGLRLSRGLRRVSLANPTL
jgi:hypothetical protein